MAGSTSEDPAAADAGGMVGSPPPPSPPSHGAAVDPEEDGNSGYADPESPNSKAESTGSSSSSSSSSSSEAVLVEHPAGPDQDPRGLQGDQDSGILVDIDGSMMEHAEEEGGRRGEDAGREDMFLDAQEQLGFAEGRRSVALEESMAMIEIRENSGRERSLEDEIASLHTRLEERDEECRRYKEERELFGGEIAKLRNRLRAVADGWKSEHLHLSDVSEGIGVDRELVASLPFHNVVGECLDLASSLSSSVDELVWPEAMIKELRGVIDLKDAEIRELNTKLCENEVSREVVASYLDSVKDVRYGALKESSDASVRRLLATISSVVQGGEPSEYSLDEKMHAVEEKTKLLIEKYTLFMWEIEQLAQCLAVGGSNFTMPPADQFGLVFEAARSELLEGKSKELHFLGKVEELEQEKAKVLEDLDRTKETLEESKSEVNRFKMELEQTENKFLTVKEKLSIAVTKGKSLVQQRDSLKQSLMEKTGELEKCFQELQQKSASLEAAEGVNEELTHSKEVLCSRENEISEREKFLHTIEKDISEVDIPEELQNADATSRIRWLVDQIKASEESKMENSNVRTALSSLDLPETISRAMLDYQINWLGTSFSKAREDAVNLENELKTVQAALGSCESQMLQAQKEIENLSESLLVEKQGKNSLQVLYEELTSKYDGATERLSKVLSEKNHLVDVLGEISGSSLEGEPFDDIDAFKDKYIEIIKERMNASTATSSALTEGLQRMQELLYVSSQESMLYENILEEEMLSQSERKPISEELNRATLEVLALRNERDTLQKDLERSEERSSLLREKLSMAVKKGKGLVQEREGLRHSLDERNSEIANLKQNLKLQESAIAEYKEQVSVLRSDLKQAQKHESDIKDERDRIEHIMLESNSTLQRITESLEQIVLPSDIPISDPMEKLSSVAQYIRECEVGKVNVEKELEKQKEEAILRSNKLADAYVTIKSLEETLIERESYISAILEEKKTFEVGKDSAEVELQKLKEETHTLTAELNEAHETSKSLKDALTKAEDRISLLMDEKAESESKSKLAIASLNTKIAACMEELAGTHGSLENQSAEVVSHLRQVRLLVRDESLPTLMTQVFKKQMGALRKMIPLLEDISSQMYSEEVQSHSYPKLENALSRLRSLPPFEDRDDDRLLRADTSMAGSAGNIPSFTEVAEELSAHTTFLGERLEQFSSYLNENLSLLFQILETTRDEVIHLVEQKESLKLQVNDMDALRGAQKMEISKLQTNVQLLLSACSDATDILHFDLLKVIYADTESQQTLTSTLESEFKVVEGGGSSLSEPENTAQKLLVAARSVKGQVEDLPSLKNSWTGTIEDLENKLRQAELVAGSAREDRDIYLERVNNLERELHSLQSFCNEMKSNIKDYQAKEIAWKDKEEELLSLQHQLSIKDREEGESLLLYGQLESLFGQVNKIETPFKELESGASKQQHSTLVDKIYYIVNNVATLQQMLNSVIVERDDLQSTVALHVDEIQQLKKTLENFRGVNEELEQKTTELNGMTTTLGRIVMKLGGNASLDENKAFDGRDLLSLLERLILSSSEESESYKLKAQELGTKLLDMQKVVDEMSTKVRSLEGSIESKSSLPETKERSVFEASTSKTGSEISEVEDVVSLGKKSIPPVTAAAHVRTMRKGSSEHLALSIDTESDRLISSYETHDKGHLFKSLNSSGLVPNQGKMIADRIDGIWVSGGRILMGRPKARMGLIAYSILLHLWVLATFL